MLTRCHACYQCAYRQPHAAFPRYANCIAGDNRLRGPKRKQIHLSICGLKQLLEFSRYQDSENGEIPLEVREILSEQSPHSV
jgi:hypothetical protein